MSGLFACNRFVYLIPPKYYFNIYYKQVTIKNNIINFIEVELLDYDTAGHKWMDIAQIRIGTRFFKCYGEFTNRRTTRWGLSFGPKPSRIHITFSPIHSII